MSQLGIAPAGNYSLILDCMLHRFRTADDKAGELSGAYCIFTDGIPAGFVQNWRKDIKQDWKFKTSALSDGQRKYFSSDEFRIKAENAK